MKEGQVQTATAARIAQASIPAGSGKTSALTGIRPGDVSL